MAKKYRRLTEGEIVLATDEIYCDETDTWEVPQNSVGQEAPNPLFSSHRQFRRRIDAHQQGKQAADPLGD